MHKHFRHFQSVMLTMIFLVMMAIFWTSKDRASAPIDEPSITAVQTSLFRPVPEPIEPLINRQDPEQAPTHASKILDRVDFEQESYFALYVPNDTTYPLWYLNDIQVPEAWDETTGSDQITIAVIDSGFALQHQELSQRWWLNTSEQGTTENGDNCWDGSPKDKQSNNCDDDNNGYVDDWRGWDFFGLDNSPQAGEINPNGAGVGHGSLVAGIIAASGDNNTGFPGVDWQAKIMPLQALSDNGSGYTSDIVAAIEYAVDNGADIINMSIGGAESDIALRAALSYARSQGVVVVAASGNCATLAYEYCQQLSSPGYMSYPAKYQEVIAVGATKNDQARASFSSYGPELDIVAPGQLLTISTSWTEANPTNAYGSSISGTSFASPLVSGVVGLILATNDQLNPDDVKQILAQSAKQNSSAVGAFDNQYGFGMVQVNSALALANSNSSTNNQRTSLDQPLIASNKGQDPANPIALDQTITTTVTTYPGDQPFIEAVNINTDQKYTFYSNKTDENGQAVYQWQADLLGQGVWQLKPHGLQLTGIEETLYLGK